MFFHSSLHRQAYSTREAREIYENKGITENVTYGLSYASGWLAKNGIHTGLVAGRGVLGGLNDSFVKGWIETYEADGRSEALKQKQLRTAVEFTKVMPASIQQLIEKGYREGARPSFEKSAELFNLGKWIQYFERGTFPRNPDPSIGFTLENGPEGLLAGQTPEARKQIFVDFVRTIIPQQLIIASGPETDMISTKEKILENKKDVLIALQYMLGEKNPDPTNTPPEPAFLLAKAALRAQYGNRDLRSARKMNAGFYEDLADHTKGFAMMPSIQSLRSTLEPSLLNGVLNPLMGIVDPTVHKEVEYTLSQKKMDRELALLSDRQELGKLTKVDKLSRERDSETLGETFSNLGGAEKIALLAIGGFLLHKMPKMFATLGVMYFGQKFLLKQEDPLNEIWAPLARGVVQKATDVVQGPTERLLGIKFADKKLTPEETAARMDLMEQFLTEEARNRCHCTTIAFSLLSEMKLGDLARYTTILSDGRVVLHYTKEFKEQARPMLERMGYDPRAIDQFFTQSQTTIPEAQAKKLGFAGPVTENMLSAGEGLGFIYYSLAFDHDPKYREMVPFIEAERRRNDCTYNNLPDTPVQYDVNGDGVLEWTNAHAMFVEMMLEGQRLLTKQGITESSDKLMTYVQKKLALKTPKRTQDVIDAENAKFFTLKRELEAETNYHGEAISMRVERVDKDKSDRVEMRLEGVEPMYLSFKEFLACSSGKVALEKVLTKMCERKMVDALNALQFTPSLKKPVRKKDLIEFGFEADEWAPLKPTMKVISFLKTPLKDAQNSINFLIAEFIKAFNALPSINGTKNLSTLKMNLEEYRQ